MTNALIRGTTPTIRFTFPFELSTVQYFYLTITQQGVTKIEKTMENGLCEGNVYTVTLTQAETLKLEDNRKCKMQFRGLLTNGEAIASNEIEADINGILKDGEI